MRTPAVVVVLSLVLGACGDSAAPHGANLQTLSSSQWGACGRGETQLRCWGSQGFLTGGNNTSTPVQPSAPFNTMALVRSDPFGGAACGITDSGALFCWSYDGQDYGAVAPQLRFSDVSLGGAFKCALERNGTIYCWGSAWGTGVAEDSPAIEQCTTPYDTYACVLEPTAIASPERFTALGSGWNHTCALALSGQVFCWGDGNLGAGPDVQSSQTPISILSSDRFTSLGTGPDGNCAVNASGQPLCWGYNTDGMLGPATGDSYLTQPNPVAMPAGVFMKSVALGTSHTCGVDSESAAWCWGTGGLGSGTYGSALPVQVLGGLSFLNLAAGEGFTCGISQTGAWCWGRNTLGQLGNGGSTDSPIPVRVANQDQVDD